MSSPEIECKRKKYFSKSEILQKLKENGDKVSAVVNEVCEELSPFDVTDEEALVVEDRLERLETLGSRGVIWVEGQFGYFWQIICKN